MREATSPIALPSSPPPWAKRLFTVGVTGTNGKTSTTALIAAALAQVASPVARVTTVGTYLDSEQLNVPSDFQGFLQTMQVCIMQGGRFAAIELTSEALALGFARAWPCGIGVFTNLSHDHLDAHESVEHYLASKAQLFLHLPEEGTAILNGCDPTSDLLEALLPDRIRIVRYGLATRAQVPATPLDLAARSIEVTWGGTRIALASSAAYPELPQEITIRAIGEVFAENALAALAASCAAGVPIKSAISAISQAAPAQGRFEIIAKNPYVVIDYAHNPDGLCRMLVSARKLCKGCLTIVFGAGGNRDKEKRQLMGSAASTADRVILTSDNPRDEDPAIIAAMVHEGLRAHQAVEIELDRAKAIARAVMGAEEQDVIVIAGKGHEAEQILATGRVAFSDHQVAQNAIQLRNKGCHS